MAESPFGIPSPGLPAVPREPTRLESVEEIRQARKPRRGTPAKEPVVDADTTPFQPFRRPPMALLCILDDGDDEGEWFRIRKDSVTIGRNEGDITIPHDNMISGRHAELSRELDEGAFRWFLSDLQSTNGTYVRIGKSLLKHNQELLIGSRRYRFDAAPLAAEAAGRIANPPQVAGRIENPSHGTVQEAGESAGNKPRATSGWQGISPTDLLASLVEVTTAGDGKRLRLTGNDNRIGRSATDCSVVLTDDPLVSPQHARIYRDGKGRWTIENMKSLNGTWLRIDRIRIDNPCQFQLGEQRFFLRVS